MAIFILNSKHKSWENTPSQESPTSVNIFELIGDTASDLPTDPYYFSSPAGRYKMAQGSLAWIISTSNFYMYNSQNQWVMQTASGGGGGGGGTDDYTQLLNLPQINSVTLTGNLTAADLSLQSIIDSGHKLDPALIAYDTSHIAVSSTDKSTWDAKSDLTIGTTGTTAAAGNHTHTLSIASDSGTSDLNLSADTKYKITAGGNTYVIKTPVDNNTTYSLASGTDADADKIILTPSSGSAQKITVPYATTAGSAASADAVAWTNVSSKPTTIAGYGITDAKIASGVITLGANTITPLTSHQSVTDNNPTLAWSTKSKVGTVGSTDLNVTMPAKPTYTASDVGLGNVTNDKQVKGLASGTTQNNLVKFGADGYTVADAGVAVENQAAGISNVDTKIPTSKSVKQNVAKTSVLDGYAIKSTGSAIATTDTINDAFGKVEKRVQVNENNISYNTNNGVKNYLKPETISGIPTGITIQYEADDSITINGAYSGSDYAYVFLHSFTHDAIQYTLSCNVETMASKYYFYTRDGHMQTTQTLVYTYSDSDTTRIVMRIAPNTSFSNVNVKLMIRPSIIADTTYQPYALSNAELTALADLAVPTIPSTTTLASYAGTLAKGYHTAFIVNGQNPSDSPVSDNCFVDFFVYSANTAQMRVYPTYSTYAGEFYVRTKVSGSWGGWYKFQGTAVT